MILETLEEGGIPIADCRGQVYDNGANMAGKYKGVQALLLQENALAVFSPCGCHTLNLCGTDSAECCAEAITFFGAVQTVYTLFSSSPQCWEILLSKTGNQSLRSKSDTRWSSRINCVKPFAANLNGIKAALEELLTLNLTPKTRTEINGAIQYVSSFTCILMSAIWFKILAPIDICNKILQARDATIDVEVTNIKELIENLQELRTSWKKIWNEATQVASSMGIEVKLPVRRQRKRKRFHDEEGQDADLPERTEEDESSEEAMFRKTVFFMIIDSVIGGLTV